MSQEVIIPESAAGERLDVVLASLTGQSRSSLQKLFKEELILIDGQPVVSKRPAAVGEKVTIGALKTEPTPATPDLPVVYEDDDLMVIDKPAGLAVHLSESGRPQATVAAFAADRGIEDDDDERTGIVHRLDKDTSGLLVVAKNQQAKEYLQSQFRERKVAKTYLALVRGRLEEAEATINLPIGRDRKQPTKRAVLSGGRPSVTHYRVIEELDGFSLVEVTLETGRTHQIRVHFSYLGHPIAGDELYGGPKVPGLNRQFLHASKLTLIGPSDQKVEAESPLPPDLASVLDQLRKEL